ncbi:hypothetical protein CYMTET_16306, partial [Cymbomonas tetramitiformis]
MKFRLLALFLAVAPAAWANDHGDCVDSPDYNLTVVTVTYTCSEVPQLMASYQVSKCEDAAAAAAVAGFATLFTEDMQNEIIQNCPMSCGACEGSHVHDEHVSAEECTTFAMFRCNAEKTAVDYYIDSSCTGTYYSSTTHISMCGQSCEEGASNYSAAVCT